MTDKLYAALHQVAQQLCGSHVMEAAFTIMPSPLAVTHGFSAQQLMAYASEQNACCQLLLLHWSSSCSAWCSSAGHLRAAVKSQMGCCPKPDGSSCLLEQALRPAEGIPSGRSSPAALAQVCIVCQQLAYTLQRSQWPSPPVAALLPCFPAEAECTTACNDEVFPDLVSAAGCRECGLKSKLFPKEEYASVDVAVVANYTRRSMLLGTTQATLGVMTRQLLLDQGVQASCWLGLGSSWGFGAAWATFC